MIQQHQEQYKHKCNNTTRYNVNQMYGHKNWDADLILQEVYYFLSILCIRCEVNSKTSVVYMLTSFLCNFYKSLFIPLSFII